jgi:C4-type Zn-finger protein
MEIIGPKMEQKRIGNFQKLLEKVIKGGTRMVEFINDFTGKVFIGSGSVNNEYYENSG